MSYFSCKFNNGSVACAHHSTLLTPYREKGDNTINDYPIIPKPIHHTTLLTPHREQGDNTINDYPIIQKPIQHDKYYRIVAWIRSRMKFIFIIIADLVILYVVIGTIYMFISGSQGDDSRPPDNTYQQLQDNNPSEDSESNQEAIQRGIENEDNARQEETEFEDAELKEELINENNTPQEDYATQPNVHEYNRAITNDLIDETTGMLDSASDIDFRSTSDEDKDEDEDDSDDDTRFFSPKSRPGVRPSTI